jgi:hypothetical protein
MVKTKFSLMIMALAFGALTASALAKDSQGQFGTSRDTPNEVYCLMGSDFLSAAVSINFQNLITDWQAKHPHAKIVRVFNYGPILYNRPNLSQTYVWVVDGRSSLNEYLVQQGGCLGRTMFIPPQRSSADPKSHFIMEITEKTYLDFLDRVADAQKQAQDKKIGIWQPLAASSKSQPGKHPK